MLEHKADPNHQFIQNNKSISLLQYVVNHKNLGQAKLLIYYGAVLDNLNIDDQEYFKQLKSASILYKDRIMPYKDQENTEAYENLA